jgi:hypothetical protein
LTDTSSDPFPDYILKMTSHNNLENALPFSGLYVEISIKVWVSLDGWQEWVVLKPT